MKQSIGHGHRILDEEGERIRIGNGTGGRRSYRRPTVMSLGNLRVRTARGTSPGVNVTHDSGTGADTFTF